MPKPYAAITGVGGYVPDYALTNEELETMVDTNDEWIKTRTGIAERRILKGEGLATSDMCEKAVKELLKKTNTSSSEIDLVICATVTPDMLVPSMSNVVCDKTDIKNAFCFDLNAACSGFLYALTTGAKFVESGSHKKVLVIGADKMSSIIDYTDRTICIIFGDGAGAVLLEPTKAEEGIMDSVFKSDGAGRHFLYQKAGGSLYPPTHETIDAREHYIKQHGRTVFKSAVKGMSEVIEKILERNHLKADDLDWLVPHQANKRIIETTSRMTGFPMEKVMVNIQKYGNTTAATIPLCLWNYEKQLKKGDDLLLAAFGGGFTWGATWVKWAY